MIRKNYLILLGLLIPILLTAQEAVSTAGGDASGSGGSVSYTVGQVVYTTYTGTNGSNAQGVQQPFEISVMTGINDVTNINLICSVYPNPTTNELLLKVEDYDNGKFSYQLYDMNGKSIENKEIQGNETSINMKGLISSIYFLKVIESNKEVKTFKIIKN